MLRAEYVILVYTKLCIITESITCLVTAVIKYQAIVGILDYVHWLITMLFGFAFSDFDVSGSPEFGKILDRIVWKT